MHSGLGDMDCLCAILTYPGQETSAGLRWVVQCCLCQKHMAALFSLSAACYNNNNHSL
jgi:hypothetical protein